MTIMRISPNYQDKVDETILETYLSFSESIVRFTEGNRLTKEGIHRIKELFGGKLVGTLYPGGQDAMFAWSVPIGKSKILLKPYYKKELITLLIHYLAVEEFGNSRTYTFEQDFVTTVVIPPVIAVAKIATDSYSIPVLITTESQGEPVWNHPQIVTMLCEITKSLAQDGYIVDLYPSNWRLYPTGFGITLEYIDLFISNKLSNVKERIVTLINDLTKTDNEIPKVSPTMLELPKKKTPLITIKGVGPRLAEYFKEELKIDCVEAFVKFNESELAKVHQVSAKKAKQFLESARSILKTVDMELNIQN